MKKLIGIILTLISLSAYPLTALEKVQANLAREPNLSGDFKQVRHITLLKQPLISYGHFSLSRKQGLVWQQTQPFKSTLTLTSDKMEQQLPDSPPMIILKAKQPALFAFTQLFLSIFSGDRRTLNQYFTYQFHGRELSWQMQLTPRNNLLQKAIKRITLRGGKHLTRIEINETKGNRMSIQFSNVRNDPQ